MIKDLAYKNRSYRRFFENEPIKIETLIDLVDLARVSASSRNMQPLKYYISCDKALNDRIFGTLAWAGYLKDWAGPIEGERPAGYIVVLEDTNLSKSSQHDQGLATQNILLGAVEQGLGGCALSSVRREELASILKLPEHLSIALVIALGKPKEQVVIVDAENGIKYWRDEQGIHYVPKRKLEDIIINL